MGVEQPLHSYKDLIVWQKGIDLAVETYALTNGFPRSEIYGLTSQMRRAAVSIPSNIAEGRRRGTRKDFLQFLRIAYGSGAELETQLLISRSVVQNDEDVYTKADILLEEVMRMLNVMLKKLGSTDS